MRCSVALLGAAVLFAACAEGPEGFVEDRAELLSEVAEASITNWHAALLAQYDIDYRVLTTRAQSEDLGALAVQRFEATGTGGLSSSGRGLLLIVDAEGERVRLEVARELEGAFPDSFVAFIEREQMAPFFAAGRVGDGIVAASELIAGRAQEAIETSTLSERAAVASSAGAGAESRAEVGGGYQHPTAVLRTDTEAQASPIDAVTAYLDAMAARDGSPDLDLYTPGTRQMLAGHVATRGQMDNLVRTYRSCPQARVRMQGEFAVVDYPGDSGRCSPWFVERSADGRWRLDLLTMQRAVRFDTRNRWHIAAPEALGQYDFAFER